MCAWQHTARSMAEVPEELEALVRNLRGVKKKNFGIVLQAAALALDGCKDEIDTDAVSNALVESDVPADEQKPFIKSCRSLLEMADGDGAPRVAPSIPPPPPPPPPPSSSS